MTLAPAFIFLAFTVVSFLMLRYVLAKFASNDRALYAVPILMIAGVVSGVLFAQLQLGSFYIWFLMIFALIIIRWHAQSRPESKKVQEIVEKTATETAGSGQKARVGAAEAKTKIEQDYAMMRRLLSFALVSYLAAFSVVFYYLFTRAG